MAWILLCKSCKFGEKNLLQYNWDNELFQKDCFLLAHPSRSGLDPIVDETQRKKVGWHKTNCIACFQTFFTTFIRTYYTVRLFVSQLQVCDRYTLSLPLRMHYSQFTPPARHDSTRQLRTESCRAVWIGYYRKSWAINALNTVDCWQHTTTQSNSNILTRLHINEIMQIFKYRLVKAAITCSCCGGVRLQSSYLAYSERKVKFTLTFLANFSL